MRNESVSAAKLPAAHDPARYRIRVAGRIDSSWSDRIEGMKIVVRQTEMKESFSELTGVVADQPALQSVIDQLYSHGHCLLGIELLSDDARIDVDSNRAEESEP
jgi:hypothetical protein